MNKLLSILQIFGLLMFTAFVFQACKDDPLSEINQSNQTNRGTSFFSSLKSNVSETTATYSLGDSSDVDYDADEYGCFEIEFPVTIVFPSGETLEVSSGDELDDAIDKWFEDAPDWALDFPTFEFPINITLEDGASETIENEDELIDLIEVCFDEIDWEEWEEICGDDYEDDYYEDEECFEFVYPILIQNPDGTISTAGDEDALWDIFDQWFEAHEDDTTGFPTFIYPIDVILDDSSIVSVANDEELDDLYEDCYGDFFELCFEINFPLNITIPGEGIVSVGSEEELDALLDAWYDNNPDTEEEPDLAFPISVTLEDGTVEEIADNDELDDLFDDCFDDAFTEIGEATILGGKTTSASQSVLVKRPSLVRKN